MAEMSADFAERFRDFAKHLPVSLVEKGLSLSWVAGSDGEPTRFSVKGNPEAWHAFLQYAVALLQQTQEKQKDMVSKVDDALFTVRYVIGAIEERPELKFLSVKLRGVVQTLNELKPQ